MNNTITPDMALILTNRVRDKIEEMKLATKNLKAVQEELNEMGKLTDRSRKDVSGLSHMAESTIEECEIQYITSNYREVSMSIDTDYIKAFGPQSVGEAPNASINRVREERSLRHHILILVSQAKEIQEIIQEMANTLTKKQLFWSE